VKGGFPGYDRLAVTEVPDAEVPDDEPFAAKVHAARTAPRQQSESSLVAEVLARVNAKPYAHGRKVHQDAVTGSGEPDLDIVWRGRAVKAEAKVGDNRPSPVQRTRMREWRKAGAYVFWFTTAAEFWAAMARIDEPGFEPDLSTPGP
jgi:hypothetical protein